MKAQPKFPRVIVDLPFHHLNESFFQWLIYSRERLEYNKKMEENGGDCLENACGDFNRKNTENGVFDGGEGCGDVSGDVGGCIEKVNNKDASGNGGTSVLPLHISEDVRFILLI